MDAKVYIAMALGRGKVASPMLSCLHPQYSFYSRLSGLEDQSGEGVKKNLHPL